MAEIKAVVFDIGNVLVGWQPEEFYDSIIGAERRKKMFAEVDLHGMNDRVDLGHDFTQTIYDEAEKNPDWRDEIRIWHDRWIEMAQPAIDHSVQLLRSLRAKDFPVFALSNFGIGSFDLAKSVYPFLNEFDRPYISGHMGVIKPNPLIYQMLEDDCGVAPECLLFADDRADNIMAADKRGWQTHLFEGPVGFAERLVTERLLSKQEAGV